MAAPTVTARGTVNAAFLQNGYQTLIAWASNPTLGIGEKSVTPSAIEGGEPIMTDTMLNTLYITKAPQCLEEWEDVVVVATYDPNRIDDLQALVNRPDSISIIYPNGGTLAFWGYLRRVEQAALVKGTQPEVTLTIVVTNFDPVHCVEAGPVWQDGTGSCDPCAYTQ